MYVGDDSGITLAWDHATHPWTIGPLVRSKTRENGRNAPSASAIIDPTADSEGRSQVSAAPARRSTMFDVVMFA
jgi:hypothetical protein